MDQMTFDNMIFELALKGYTSKEIAVLLCHNERTSNAIDSRIRTLYTETHQNYNLGKYAKIQFARSLRNSAILNKDFLESVLTKLHAGKLFIEIAIEENIPEETITSFCHKNIPKFYGQEYYANLMEWYTRKTKNPQKYFKRLEQLERNGNNLSMYSNSRIVKNYYQYQKAKKIIFDYINSGYTLTIDQLAGKYQVQPNYVSSLLRNKDTSHCITTLITEHQQDEILQKKEQQRKENIKRLELSPSGYKEIEELAKTLLERHRANFWLQFLLTMQISIKELAMLLKVESDSNLKCVLYTFAKSEKQVEKYTRALYYLVANVPDISGHFNEAKRFLIKYELLQKINKQAAIKMLEQLYDKDYNDLIHTKKDPKDLTEEEKQIIFQYRQKYALPWSAIPYKNIQKKMNIPLTTQQTKQREALAEFNSELILKLRRKQNDE